MKRKRYKQILSPPKFPNEEDEDDNGDYYVDVVRRIPREEERFGKWVGLVIAIFLWLVLGSCYCAHHPMRPPLSYPELEAPDGLK